MTSPPPPAGNPGKTFAKDLRPGAQVKTYFLCKEKSVHPRRAGSGTFFRLTLTDRTGQVSAVHWEPDADLTASFKVGDVVLVEGMYTENPIYGPQIRLDDLRKLRDGQFNPADLEG